MNKRERKKLCNRIAHLGGEKTAQIKGKEYMRKLGKRGLAIRWGKKKTVDNSSLTIT